MTPDTSDIATRLRQTRADMIGTDDEQHYWDCHEAASHIELLEAAYKSSGSALAVIDGGFKNAVAEIQRLRLTEHRQDVHPLDTMLRLTLRLRQLTNAGQCESGEADAIRDDMQAVFNALSESEREAARMMSAEIARLRLTHAEREAVRFCVTASLPETEKLGGVAGGLCRMHAATLRGLLERTK